MNRSTGGFTNPANTATVDIGGVISDFFGFQCIADFVFRIVDIAIISAGLALLVYLVWGGVEWLVAGSDKGKIENARSRLTNALIGVAIIATSWVVWQLTLAFFGINAPNICTEDPFSGSLTVLEHWV